PGHRMSPLVSRYYGPRDARRQARGRPFRDDDLRKQVRTTVRLRSTRCGFGTPTARNVGEACTADDGAPTANYESRPTSSPSRSGSPAWPVGHAPVERA